MLSKKAYLMAAAALVCVMFLAASPYIHGDKAEGWRNWVRLEGAWILRVTGLPIGMSETIYPTDVLGRTAVVRTDPVSNDMNLHALPGMCEDGFCLCPQTYRLTTGFGEAKLIAPRIAVATIVQYGIRAPTEAECSAGNCRDQIECIWVTSGRSEFTDSETQEGTASLAVFSVAVDQDGDLLPDEGAEPLFCMQYGMVGKRLPLIPPCEPAPPE